MASNRPASLTRNFIWTLPANVIYVGCQWAIIVLLAKIASPDIVGQFALATAIAVPIAFITDFRLRTLFVTDCEGKYRLDEILGLRLFLASFSILTIFVICSIAHYSGSMRLIILLVALAQILDSLSDTFYGKLQRDEQMDRIAISQIARGILSASALMIILYSTRSLVWAVFGLACGRAAVLLFYDICYENGEVGGGKRSRFTSYFNRLWPAWNTKKQLQTLWIALPVAVASILVSVNTYAPRYALESFMSRRDLGIYAAMGYIPSGYFLIAMALAHVVFPRLSKLFAAGDVAGFRRLMLRVAALFGALGLLGVFLSAVAGPLVLRIVYRPEYAQYAVLLRYLMVVGLAQLLTTAMQAGLTAASQFRSQLVLFVCVTAASFAGCIILVPRMGLTGAALAILISNVLQLAGSTWLAFRTMAKRAREVTSHPAQQLQPAL